MKTKLSNFRLDDDAESALVQESERTGKTKTAVVEDLLLFRRIFGDEADAAVHYLAAKHKLTPRKVVEFCILKAAGIGRDLPFSVLAAA